MLQKKISLSDFSRLKKQHLAVCAALKTPPGNSPRRKSPLPHKDKIPFSPLPCSNSTAYSTNTQGITRPSLLFLAPYLIRLTAILTSTTISKLSPNFWARFWKVAKHPYASKILQRSRGQWNWQKLACLPYRAETRGPF